MHTRTYAMFVCSLFAVIAMLYSLYFNSNIVNSLKLSESDFWSEPEVSYFLPDSADGIRYLSAHIEKGQIYLVYNNLKRTNDYRALVFSYIMKTEINAEGNISNYILSDVNYMAEGPSALFSNNGVHIIWGERREDPGFETWEFSLPPIGGFTTALFYTSDDIIDSKKHVKIYQAGLSELGRGAVKNPEIYIKIDDHENLHVVLQSWRLNDDIGGEAPFITYIRKKYSDVWEEAKFPLINEGGFPLGGEPVIETYSDGRLIFAYVGAAHSQPEGGLNDVFIATSDDNGDSWNEPELIYVSGKQHMARLLRIYKDKEGRLHLLWGRQISGGLGVGELWHTYSEDGGNTWTDPEMFLKMGDHADLNESVILEYDVVFDQKGCIHWTARTFEFQSGIGDGTSDEGPPGLYNRWCSSNKQWCDPELLDFIRDLSFASAVDNDEQKIYLFWADDTEDGNRKAMYYSKKNLKDPEPSPVISQSGPLQLHANYPNPFNPATRIPFTLEEPGEVTVSVYDMAGRRVLYQELGAKPAGLHIHEVSLAGMMSGAYVYEIALNGAWRKQSTMMFVK